VVYHRLSRCKSVYGTESHAPVNTPKRREHYLIYAAVNLTPDYTRRLRLTFCTIKLTTDRHEASRGLFATAELLVWSKLTTCSRHLRHCYIISIRNCELIGRCYHSFTSCRLANTCTSIPNFYSDLD